MEFEVGEVWYGRHPGGRTLVEVLITDVTDLTIEVKSVESPYERKSRYKIDEFELIECVKGKD